MPSVADPSAGHLLGSMAFSWRELHYLKLRSGQQREIALSQVRELAASLHWSFASPQDVHAGILQSYRCHVVLWALVNQLVPYLVAGVSSPATSVVNNGEMVMSPMDYREDNNSSIWTCAFCNIECSAEGTKPSFAGSLCVRLLREGKSCHAFLETLYSVLTWCTAMTFDCRPMYRGAGEWDGI